MNVEHAAIYQVPEFLDKTISAATYRRWLQRKAMAHCKRDRKRHPDRVIRLTEYKRQIHEAVRNSGGSDWYTGEALRWDQISTYSNDESKAGRSRYKAGYALLPTVDHVAQGDAYQFVICGWRTNDAKNDLSADEFVELCRRVVAHNRSRAG